ncbi:hypothetical protein H0266_03000 [Halobacillus locisalis]|uniref:YhhN-like protein n=1 Tax=Halobacillus locisalis TaxID=220753 RepID=A0A838CPE1_9BACI|nr:hypothetical protein [Halobacillus locisalis]MBA2173860.1 hypothetical protein [Halobacillus locisalis]
MAASFYWYAWLIVIIVFFYIESDSLKKRVLCFTGVAMCLYSVEMLNHNWFLFFHPLFLFVFGLNLWVKEKKRMVQHFWPFLLSLGYSAAQLFLVVAPLWLQFPFLYPLFIISIYLLFSFVQDLLSVLGLWLMINGLGMLWSTLVFSVYEMEAVVSMNGTLLLVMKGFLTILVLHAIFQLKRWVKRNSSRKGAAPV